MMFRVRLLGPDEKPHFSTPQSMEVPGPSVGAPKYVFNNGRLYRLGEPDGQSHPTWDYIEQPIPFHWVTK